MTSAPLDLLREQLWAPALASGSVRVVVNPGPSPAWGEVERYRMLPDARRARLLVPVAPAPVPRRLLTNYRALRAPGTALARAALGAAVGVGLPAGRDVLSVQVRVDVPEARQLLPTELVARTLGRRVHAATGVRDGDNRKATLHLVDGRGTPVGFAKLGWSTSTDTAIRAETLALQDLDGGVPTVRTPRVLAELTYASHPILVVEPLPADARRVQPESVSTQEMFALTPVVRQGHPAGTQQMRDVRSRLEHHAVDHAAGGLARPALGLLAELSADSTLRLPVVERWHGDLAPWNMARAGDGDELWVWDWESSQRDAVAGLDGLHWSSSLSRLRAERNPGVSDLLAEARPLLVAVGVPTTRVGAVGACYAIVIVERACALAAEAGSWSGAREAPEALARLLEQAAALLPAAGTARD